jgi:hypothetical protein
MKKPTIEDIKNKTKTYVPAIAAGVAFGAAISAIIVNKQTQPKDKVYLWLPSDAVRGLKQGRVLILHTDDHGDFAMKYLPHEN